MKQNCSARRIGAMAPIRNRTSEVPTYQQVLAKYGLLQRDAGIGEAWSLWKKVCEDAKVKSLSQEIDRPKHLMSSVTAGYLHYGKVLAAMSARQIVALKKRVGVTPSPEKQEKETT